jgi:hypothetical protein
MLLIVKAKTLAQVPFENEQRGLMSSQNTGLEGVTIRH